MARFAKLGFLFFLCSVPVWAVQIVTDGSTQYCEEITLLSPLKIYRDPALILNRLIGLDTDAASAWDAMQAESPVMTTLGTGKVHLMRLDKPQPFKHYSEIAQVYEMADPKLKLNRGLLKSDPEIVPIKICGDEAYSDTLGFVFASDLEEAQQLAIVGAVSLMPPSTPNRPVPRLNLENSTAATNDRSGVKPLF